MARAMRLDAEQWASVVARAQAAAIGDAEKAGEPDSLVAAVAQHLVAPVRASLVATAGRLGTMTRLTLVDDRALLVTQPMAEQAGETRVDGEVQLVFAKPDEIWTAIASALPPLAALRAPAAAAAPAEAVALAADQVAALLEREQANVQVRVEAWREATQPAVVWGRLWSVVDDRLLDVRTSEGALKVTERPFGSVAAELQWALVGAVEATTAPSSHDG
ncbi:MAG: hypothetical protein IPL43_12215 [Micropruina sp.]|nr:hypothetical protein [Micropruina sp.]